MPYATPSPVDDGGGALKLSSSTSNIILPGEVQIQSTKNLGHQLDMNRGGVHSSTGNSSGLSVGTGSMITDGNSAPSGIPRLQRSASINTDSCLRVPASPLSFSSNNISASSVLDGGSFMQQSLCQDHMQKQGVSSATSLPLLQDPDNMLQSLKKPQFDIRQDDHLQPLVDQQLLENPENSQLPRYQNPQMQALIQQNWLQQRHQQQQILQSLSPMQRVHIQQQQLQKQQQHLRQQFYPQILHQGPYIKRPFDNGICARRLMQYMYHQRHRPPVSIQILFIYRLQLPKCFSWSLYKQMCSLSFCSYIG